MQIKINSGKCVFYPFKNRSCGNSDKKIFKKSCQKIWWNKKMVVTLHSQTGNNNPEMLKILKWCGSSAG